MKFVEWCTLFVIGDETIDKQHQELLEIANTFHDESRKGFNKKILIETLNQLIVQKFFW